MILPLTGLFLLCSRVAQQKLKKEVRTLVNVWSEDGQRQTNKP